MNAEDRYSRQLVLPGFGRAAQRQLGQARVLVAGAGGLGVPALQYLAGMGIGMLGIADSDVVSLSNLHRQVLYATADVGRSKAIAAAAACAALNPEIQVTSHHTHLTPLNALDIIGKYDLVIDATDNFSARYLINDACVLLGKPFIYGAVHQYEGQVSVFNLDGGPTYRCLYPKQPSPAEIPDCNTAGVLGIVPGITGCHQALEAVKVITGIGTTLSGYLLVFDLLHNTQHRIKLKSRPESRNITALQDDYNVASCSPGTPLDVAILQEWLLTGKPIRLVDVREPHEYAQGHLEAAASIPLDELDACMSGFSKQVPVVTICRQGPRSMKAAARLAEQMPGLQAYYVKGGMQQWLAQTGQNDMIP